MRVVAAAVVVICTALQRWLLKAWLVMAARALITQIVLLLALMLMILLLLLLLLPLCIGSLLQRKRCTHVLHLLRFFKLEDTAGIIIALVSALMTPSQQYPPSDDWFYADMRIFNEMKAADTLWRDSAKSTITTFFSIYWRWVRCHSTLPLHVAAPRGQGGGALLMLTRAPNIY